MNEEKISRVSVSLLNAIIHCTDMKEETVLSEKYVHITKNIKKYTTRYQKLARIVAERSRTKDEIKN